MENQEHQNRKNTVHDGLLILALLLAALAVWLLSGGGKRDDGAVIHVQTEGREDEYYPLSKNGVYALNDGTNTLVV